MLQDWSAISVLHPPLYSLILAPFYSLWGDPEWGARVTSAVLGGLWVWPTLWLARETIDEQMGWAAGLLVALMPSAVEVSTRVLPDALFGLCLTVFLLLCVRTLRTGSLAWASLTGVVGGLATLGRPEGMGYLFIAWGLLLPARAIVGKPWTTPLILTRVMAITVVWLAVLCPYTLLIRHQTGAWHWSGKVGITLRWAESVGDERPNAFVEQVITDTRDADVPQSLLRYVLSRPGEIVRRIFINLHLLDKYTLPDLLHTGGIGLVLLGVAHLRFQRAPARPEWFLLGALLPLGGLLLFVVEARYFIPVIPVLSLIAAIGLARMGGGQAKSSGHWPSRAGIVLLSIVLLSFIPWLVRPWFRQDPTGVEKAAGLWLQESAGAGTIFIGRYPVLGYYAKAGGIPFARRSLDDLLSEGHAKGAAFLIVDNVHLPETRQDLLGLVAGDAGHPALELVHISEDRGGRRVLIYRIRKRASPV